MKPRILKDGELVDHPEWVYDVELPWWMDKLAHFLAHRFWYKNPDGLSQFFWRLCYYANLSDMATNIENELKEEAIFFAGIKNK